MMKKTYVAPKTEIISLDTEEILEISFTGFGALLEDSDDNPSSKNPASDFGDISLF